MILEHAILPVRPGSESDFEEALRTARPLISSPGFCSLSISRSIESPNLAISGHKGATPTSDGIDPGTSTERMMLNILATLAEYERELIVERVNAGIAVARDSCTSFGRPPVNLEIIAEKLARRPCQIALQFQRQLSRSTNLLHAPAGL